ncbi:hypothetical protein [Candidatus Igneacidithiobacillus taiwanensis]|uniref:hypothetical protein n=1 Tax=Candidatus Igneacidithiobacillus taiwanensis TaxID=1945924 RepID=UPI00289E5E52|nr:hypothetical protein [Candidatus Igneacidithiobacillus taiwanensis]
MSKLTREVENLARVYCRHGGKRYRRRQKGLWLRFVQFCEPMGCFSLGQIGKRHIEAYFAELRQKGRTDNTLYEHKLAIVALYEAANLNPPTVLARIGNPKPNRAERRRRRIQRQWQQVAANDPIFDAENSEPIPPDLPPPSVPTLATSFFPLSYSRGLRPWALPCALRSLRSLGLGQPELVFTVYSFVQKRCYLI